MGIRNYLIEGLSGTGKTSVCNELQRRGYHAIHGDRELAYRGDPETGEPTEGFAHEHHIWHVDKVRFARAGSLPHPARNQPGTTSGPQWTRYQRTTLANSGQLSSQAIAAVRPVPQVMPQPRFSLARRKPGVQIPSPPPPNSQGQSVASLEPATLTACWGRAEAGNAHGRVLDPRLGSGCRSWSTVRATIR